MDFTQKSKNYSNNRLKLILSCNKDYLAFLCSDDISYFKSGLIKLANYLESNPCDFDILLGILFFSIYSEDKENVTKYNNILKKYRKFIKNNNDLHYTFYIFLQGLIAYKKNQIRGVKKVIKKLYAMDNGENYANTYALFLQITINDVPRKILTNIEMEEGKFWTNITLYMLFEKYDKIINFNEKIYKKYVKWALNNSIEINNSMIKYERYQNILVANSNENSYNIRLYKNYNYDNILIAICKKYLKEENTDYFFYKQALSRQMNIEGLIQIYIKCCIYNNDENIEIYHIKKLIEDDNVDTEILAFLYHIIIKNKQYGVLALLYREQILKKGKQFLDKKIIGKYYYTIYKYMLVTAGSNSSDEIDIINILYEVSFSYEIKVDSLDAKWIAIKDYEITDLKYYPIKNGIVHINAITPNFDMYIFKENKREIIKSKTKIYKIVQDTNVNFFSRMYNLNITGDFTIINIAKKYIIENINNNENKNSEEEIKILEKVLKMNILSIPFKMDILKRLGSIYYYCRNFKMASICYKKVSEKYIRDDCVNNMLIAYVAFEEYEKAIEIIIKKEDVLKDDILSIAIKMISKQQEYIPQIAHKAYNLLIRGKISDTLINIVTNYYKMNLSQWINIRNKLKENNMYDKKIDEYILEYTVYTQSLNKNSEEIFLKLYEEDIDNINIEIFLNYCVYESFKGEYIFNPNIIYIMEYIFLNTNDFIIGYSLVHMYISGKYNLIKKQDIIDKVVNNLQKDNINFEIFYKNKDKFKDISYFYKNTPFIHKSQKGKNVELFYKNAKDSKFLSVEMKYFKYGMYIATLPIFYDENIDYYFLEHSQNGSVSTIKNCIVNNDKEMFDIDDEYFKLNNMLIQTFEDSFTMAQKLFESKIKDYDLRGKIL